MDKQLGTHLPLQERLQFLQDNCDNVEEMDYMKQFTPDELLLLKERLAEVAIEINDLDEEKKAFTDQIKHKQKPLKLELNATRTNIKQKSILVKEEVFKFIDQAEGQVAFYNVVGDLVSQRPIYPQERQTNIFQLQKRNRK